LVFKKDSARLKTKTFLAIYICLAILGFSQSLQIAFDPYGVIGWIYQSFPQWIIISRLLAVLEFPSLTACYSLVFLTLYKATEINSSRLWHQDWRLVTAIVIVHYLIVLMTEIIANTAKFAALIIIVICEVGFSAWGAVICVVYLFAGGRLLMKLKDQEKSAVRKIVIITYFTAILAIIYALVSLVSTFFAIWLIFRSCFGLYSINDPNIWLSLQIIRKVIELFLGLVMLYSMMDFVTYTVNLIHSLYQKCLKQSNHTPPQSIETLSAVP
jgi:hypothetical protein